MASPYGSAQESEAEPQVQLPSTSAAATGSPVVSATPSTSVETSGDTSAASAPEVKTAQLETAVTATAAAEVTQNKASSFEEAFKQGVEFYQKNDYSAAQAAFEKALVFRPADVSTLTNLALTHQRLGHKGWALGYLRKSLVLDSGHEQAREALEFILKENPPLDIPHQIETWESFRTLLLTRAGLMAWAWLSLLLLFSTGWSWLTYMGARRRALESESVSPAMPILPLLFSTCLFLSLFVTGAKWQDSLQERATIVVEKVSALTSPNSNSPSLFDLFEGLEVRINSRQGEWAQVTYPGSLTGWVLSKNLLVTQDGGL